MNPRMRHKSGWRRKMPDWVWFLLIFAGWLALQRWVLPRFGVQT